MRSIAAEVRRSIALRTMPLLIAVSAVHVLARPRPWRFDGGWALLQYGFVTTMLGPAVAALAAIDGASLGRARDSIVVTGRAWAVTARCAAAAWWWGVVAFAVGLGLVVAIAVSAGADHPDAWTLFVGLVPPLGFLGAAAALGAAIGMAVRRWYAGPLAGIGAYITLVIAFVTHHEVLVRVGGANEEVLGLRVLPRYVAAQLVWFALLAVAAVAVGSRPLPSLWAVSETLGLGCSTARAGLCAPVTEMAWGVLPPVLLGAVDL